MNLVPLKPPYKLMIVDDHKFLVELLAQELSLDNQIEVAGMANRGSTARHIAAHEDVDIVLLDMEFRGEDGIGIARDLLQQKPDIRILGLSVHDRDHHAISLLEVGGLGFISKNATRKEISDAIRRVANGNMAISPEIAANLATQCTNPSPVEQVRTLTRKEFEVFKCIAQGHSIGETANRLGVSRKTILGHRVEIKKKLNVKTDVQLCLIAIRSGLIKIQNGH